MLTFLPPFVRGCLAFLLLCLNIAAVSLPLFTVALLKFLVPIPAFRRLCSHILNLITSWWVSVNGIWMRLTQEMDWQVEGLENLNVKGWCLVTSNHQAYADIFVVQRLLNRRVPQLKFFLKQELIWIPVIGLCWWALDFPFMKRYSKSYLKKHPQKKGDDLLATQKACEKLRIAPAAMFNFMEGTRFTPEKHATQGSPYKHLLKPRVLATGFVLSAMGEQMDRLVDITIHYPDGVPDNWEFLCGKMRRVRVVIESTPIPAEFLGKDYSSDSAFRKGLQRWVNELWKAKDEKLEELQTEEKTD